MRRTIIAIALVALVGASVASYLIYRSTRPVPTPNGWRAYVTTLAGDGSPLVRDALSTAAAFSDPFGLAVDADGTVYVADAGESNRIRKITPDGNVTTLVGAKEGFADGAGAAAAFNTPSALVLAPDGNLYVADTGNNRIRKITPAGVVSTVAGDGAAGYRDGPASQAQFNAPVGLAVDASGNIYVADTYNDRIRKITIDGQVGTIAGAGTPGYADGQSNAALFDTPCGIVVTSDGSLVVADTGNNRLRKITSEGNVTTLYEGQLEFSKPIGLAISHDDFLYVTELDRSRVLQIVPAGSIHVLAGDGPGFAGSSDVARFNQPAGLALSPRSNRPPQLYLADSGNYLIRKLDQTVVPVTTTETNSLPRLTNETIGIPALLWPLDPQERPHEVVATIGEVRGSFDSDDARHHLHSGLDVFGAYGAIVRAVRSEKVTNPLANWGFDSLNEGVRAGIVSYVHIHVGRNEKSELFDDPRFLPMNDAQGKLVRIRIRRGTRFQQGDAVGTINRMYHVHLNIGPPGAEINPLSLSPVGFNDSIPPIIEKDGIQLFDAPGARLTEKSAGRLLVSGSVRIVVDAFDRTNMNAKRRRLGLYKLGYQVLKTEETPAPGFAEPLITMQFDRLPGFRDATKIVYAAESGITVYGSATTRFLYEVTNTMRDGRAATGVWDTSQLPKGDYVLRIIAADYSGNEAQEGRDLLITVR